MPNVEDQILVTQFERLNFAKIKPPHIKHLYFWYKHTDKKQDKKTYAYGIYIYIGGYLVAQLKRQKQADWATR